MTDVQQIEAAIRSNYLFATSTELLAAFRNIHKIDHL